MLSLNSAARYLLYHKAADMRKSFSGLSGIVNNELRMPIMSGDIFIFLNKRRTHIKLLQWETDGFAIYHKRLEEGTFELPSSAIDGAHGIITCKQLTLILQGISLKKVFYRKRFMPKKVA
jgi:transposase